jgi:hypothetical protein
MKVVNPSTLVGALELGDAAAPGGWDVQSRDWRRRV